MAIDKTTWHYGEEGFDEGLDYDQSGVHIAFFLRWLIDNDLISEDLREEVKKRGNDSSQALSILNDFCDGSLIGDDLSEEGEDFAEARYYDDYLEMIGELSSELETITGFEESVYSIIYNDANYAKVSKGLDGIYSTYRKSKNS